MLFSMAAVNCAVLKIVGIVFRCRAEGSGQDKPVIGINRCMPLQALERFVIFNCPI